MRSKVIVALASVIFLQIAMPAVAQSQSDTLQIISGSSGARGVQIQAFGPIGQSFTSIDSTLTSFGFQFQTFNSSASNVPVTFSLLSGAGLGGSLIYSQQLMLPSNLPERTGVFYDFTVPNLAVTIGGNYTALLSSTTSRVGLALGPEYNIYTGQPLGGDAYAGGRAYFTTQPFPNCTNSDSSNCDLNFRVTGMSTVSAAVPEPSTWSMMILGMSAAGFFMRRRRNSVMNMTRVGH